MRLAQALDRGGRLDDLPQLGILEDAFVERFGDRRGDRSDHLLDAFENLEVVLADHAERQQVGPTLLAQR